MTQVICWTRQELDGLRCRSGRQVRSAGSASHAQSCAQLSRYAAMARNAQRAEVLERALPATFNNWHDVVRVPRRAQPRIWNAEFLAAAPTSAPWQPPQRARARHRVFAAARADATIALVNVFAHICRAGTQAPVVDAIVAAKCSPWWLHFNSTPATKRAPIFATRKLLGVGPPARLATNSAHQKRIMLEPSL